MSILTAAGWRSETAHIRAVVPPQVSFALTFAPLSNSTLTASVFPVRDAIMSAVSPYWVSGTFGSAPALMSISTIAAWPFSAASCIGVAPARFAVDTLAPARISSSAVSRSSSRTAQCSAVVPSICGALTSAFRCSRERTASLFRFMAASASSLLAAPTLTADSKTTTQQPSTSRIDIWSPKASPHVAKSDVVQAFRPARRGGPEGPHYILTMRADVTEAARLRSSSCRARAARTSP